MIKMTNALSDISRTNQLRLTENPKEMAEKLYQYLFKMDKGIESFSANNLDLSKYEGSSLNFYQKQHRAIKYEIKQRLDAHGEKSKYSDIQYFLSYFDGKNYVFFLSSNKNHSGWKQLFCKDRSNRERILNLIFKVYLLLEELSFDTINGFEKLLLIHSINPTKNNSGIVVWGQNLFINYNHHDVLTLTLSRKKLLFLSTDSYSTLDSEEMGEIAIYKKKNYYFSNKLDGRGKNSINFMYFPKSDDKEPIDKFQKTQLYHYQNLMRKLENFLDSCNIAYDKLNFQADHYLRNPFIKNIDVVENLEIINNSGTDLTEFDKCFLKKIFNEQGVSTLSFLNDGKTISTYECVENEENAWKINEIIPWTSITLDTKQNYLVFNKTLDDEAESSMSYQQDGIWYPTSEIDDKKIVDFYSQLKSKINYLNTENFISIQGINISEFRIIRNEKSTDFSVLTYAQKRKKNGTENLYINSEKNVEVEIEDSLIQYFTKPPDNFKLKDKLEELSKNYNIKIKISPELQKILIELGIKNWIRKSLSSDAASNNPKTSEKQLSLFKKDVDVAALSINPQSFSKQRFFAIYVRKPRNQKAKAVAVEFFYEDGNLYIKNVLHDLKQIEKQFPFLRRRKNEPKTLLNNQQYFVDKEKPVFISCYTNNFFTPTLIGRESIIDDLENGTLEINRQQDNKFLPLVSYYNDDIKPIKLIQNMICLDLHNEEFLQYYVPPAKSLDVKFKKGFRVYHLIGKTYAGETIPITELMNHPITSLHFSTLTQNILKISDNSQSSLLQKIAKVFVEN